MEATSASVTEAMVRAECKFVDGRREPGCEIYAARYRKDIIALSAGSVEYHQHTKIRTNAYRESHSYEQM